MYDVAVIGAGIIGTAISRELSKYNIKVILIEKENDVANGTTKANSAIVHAGYDAEPGTNKAKFNVLGNAMYDKLCEELDVPFKRVGSLVIASEEKELNTLKELYEKGMENNVPELKIINREEVRKMEPNLNKGIVGALYAGSCGIVGPFELAIALAENAVENGVELILNSKVTGIYKENQCFNVHINEGERDIKCKYIINCAGVYGDSINNMVDTADFSITPRRGEYFILDKSIGNMVNSVIFQCPNNLGKGVLVTPTVHGNLLVGPNAEDIEDKEDIETTNEGLEFIKDVSKKTVEHIPFNKVITSFSGLRATSSKGDFIIEELKLHKNFINVVGIESPGLTAAPAIAVYVAELLRTSMKNIEINNNFKAKRSLLKFMDLSSEEKRELIKKDSRYGKVICRCEGITEGEIVDVIHRKVGARTVDGVKRRIRPGMGRCQGGFCMPRVMEILARELDKDMKNIVKDGLNSKILIGDTRKNEIYNLDVKVHRDEQDNNKNSLEDKNWVAVTKEE